MTKTVFERATFGNKGGSHQLLSTTIATAGTSVLNDLQFLVDRPAGHVDAAVTWSPYWGCQPLGNWWVLWRGEEDFDAPRGNMVKVEVALLPVGQCGLLDDLNVILAAVGYTEEDHYPGNVHQLAGMVVQRLAAMSCNSSVAIPDIAVAPTLLRALWSRLWPNARASLSLRTVFASEYLGSAATPPQIAVFPAEHTPRWRGYPVLGNPEPLIGPAALLFGERTSPSFERLMQANAKIFPGEVSVLTRVERIVERLQRLHAGQGVVADALLVIRTQEGFPAGFSLPPEDLGVLSTVMAEFREARPEDIRSLSLTRLEQMSSRDAVESAVATWIQTHLPITMTRDALWILQHHLSEEHVQWWRDAVSHGLARAIGQHGPEWAEALWIWWTGQTEAVDWVSGYLDGSKEVEGWLVSGISKDVEDDLLKKIFELCRKYHWSSLLARALGTERSVTECIANMRKVLERPEEGLKNLLMGRADSEIVMAAATNCWPPLTAWAVQITLAQPQLFRSIQGLSGLIPLLVAHLGEGGIFPPVLGSSDFFEMVFDGVLQGDEKLKQIAGFLGTSAGASALDHTLVEDLLATVNAEVVAGAVEVWWNRFLIDNHTDAPPQILRRAVVNSAQSRCGGSSITLIISLLQLLPEIGEDTFTEWMMHTGFSWDDGDHQRLATLLLERQWRSVTKTFLLSWKRELKAVAWLARDLLSWFDRFWLSPIEVETTETAGAFAYSPMNKVEQKMKILFLASNPFTTNQLALDEESRQIENKVRDAKHRDRVIFKSCWAVRPNDLQQALLEHNPVVVHFSGHGGGAIGLVLHAEDQNKDHLIATESLTDLFRVLKDDIRVVVLNACYSQVQAKAIVQEIDFVVGMSDSIGDKAARDFASAFYRGLAFGRPVQQAFELGLNELCLVGLAHEAHIPQLLVRSGVDASTTVLVGKSAT